MNEIKLSRKTADAIIKRMNELDAQGKFVGELVCLTTDFINSLVSEDEKTENYIVPPSWLDPLLTSKNSVIGEPPYDCQDIERLLNAIRERTETDSEIAKRVWGEWVDYMNEYEPCPMGDHRIPPLLLKWLDKEGK